MPGPAQPWDQSEDPRENTMDLPRIDLAGLADYFRGVAPPPKPAAPARTLTGLAESSAGPAEPPAGLAESPGQADGDPRDQGRPLGGPASPSVADGSDGGTAGAAGTAAAGTGPAGAVPLESVAARSAAAHGTVTAGLPPATPPTAGNDGGMAARSGPASYAPAGRTAPGSLADLRSRLARLPAGHPSSPYEDGGQARPLPTRLKHLELGLPAPAREPGDLPAFGEIGVREGGSAVAEGSTGPTAEGAANLAPDAGAGLAPDAGAAPRWRQPRTMPPPGPTVTRQTRRPSLLPGRPRTLARCTPSTAPQMRSSTTPRARRSTAQRTRLRTASLTLPRNTTGRLGGRSARGHDRPRTFRPCGAARYPSRSRRGTASTLRRIVPVMTATASALAAVGRILGGRIRMPSTRLTTATRCATLAAQARAAQATWSFALGRPTAPAAAAGLSTAAPMATATAR